MAEEQKQRMFAGIMFFLCTCGFMQQCEERSESTGKSVFTGKKSNWSSQR